MQYCIIQIKYGCHNVNNRKSNLSVFNGETGVLL